MSVYFGEKPPKAGSISIIMADFPLFLAIWNNAQNQKTPHLHFHIAKWLEQRWVKGDRELLLMVFRSAGKSTIAGLFAAWLLYRKPDLRILVLAADEALATKMVRNVKRIIERHTLCRAMKPKSADQWASDRFTINRPMELRDPSMMARGLSGNLTGSRADIIICDDVEVPNTCDTAEKRKELRARLTEISYVLVPGGTQLYIGTPHNYYSIYASKARAEIDEVAPFLQGFKRLEIPVLDRNGQSAWPERFSTDALAKIRRHTGPNKFNSQMMLQPVNIADGRLNADLLHWYSGQPHYAPELRELYLNGKRMISASAFWDPAFGSARGDHSVLAVIFTDDQGRYYIQHVEYIKPSSHSEQDEATQQCRIVAGIAKELRLPSVAIEINGLGRFLPNILRNALVEARTPCAVKEVVSTKNKDLRILEAFDAPLAARILYVNEQVRATPFITEMREWQPTRSKTHDDGLDAVAGALAQEPVRLKRGYIKGAHQWTGARAKPQKAKTDFDV